MNESNIYFLNIYYKCQQRRKYLEPEPEAIVVVVKHRNAKEKVLLCAELCHHVNIHPVKSEAFVVVIPILAESSVKQLVPESHMADPVVATSPVVKVVPVATSPVVKVVPASVEQELWVF